MGIIEKIVVSDETLRALEQDALRHGHTVAEEVAQGQASEEVQHEGLQRQRPRPLARSGVEDPDGRCSR